MMIAGVIVRLLSGQKMLVVAALTSRCQQVQTLAQERNTGIGGQ